MITKEKISKVVAEDLKGFFGILPKHIDFVTKIVPSILTYEGPQGEGYIVLNEGILVKQGDTIQLATRDAFEGRDLGKLHETLERQIASEAEEEKQLGLEVTKLELGIIKSFYDLKTLKS
jgi:F-type H+-transporting ATPase subunit epsilon